MASLKTEFRCVTATVVAALFFLSCFTTVRADAQRLWVDAQINDKPVRLAFDTGAETSFLYRRFTTDLGLAVTNWPTGQTVDPGKVPYGITEECKITIGGTTVKGAFAVIYLPVGLNPEGGGALGWPALKNNVIRFDALKQNFEILEKVPKNIFTWLKFRLRSDSDVLALEIPDAAGETETICIDTGSEQGMSLNPREWRAWIETYLNRPKTICAYYMSGAGLLVQEETWAKEISFGKLVLRDVPLREANAAEIAMVSGRYRATFGLAALKRFDLIVDGKDGVAYLKLKKTPAVPYNHNRSGVAFTPADLDKSNDLIAHVLEGTPAYQAGVRDGDVLVRADGKDVTKWRSDPDAKQSAGYWQQPSGTKIKLVLKSGEKEFQTTVVLRDLIGPSIPSRSRH